MQIKRSIIVVGGLCIALALSAKNQPKLEVVTDDRLIQPSETIPLVSYADVIEVAAPTVVSVYTTRVINYSDQQLPPGIDQLFRNFGRPGQDPRQAVPQSREVTGLGSGVIISEDGYIITNNHVIRDERGGAVNEIRVQLDDEREFLAEVVGTDAKTDIAVIKIDADEPLKASTIANSDRLRTGDIVFAIGSPQGLSQSVSQGIVSATGRTSLDILGPGSYENFIQTDAAINLGNSGGALIDAWGRLVGINTAIFSATGGSIGLGYAVPSNMALRVARNLIELGEVPRGLLGLYPVDLDAGLAEAFDLESTRGALVNQVQEDSPAQKAGIRHGDIILKIDAFDIDSADQLRLTVSQMAPGSKVIVTLVRNGKTIQKKVVLGSVSGKPVTVLQQEPSALEGVMLSELSDTLREEYNVPDGMDGVAIRDVVKDSPFAETLVKEMVIIEVNKEPVSQPDDLKELLREGSNSLYVWSLGQPRYLVIRIPEE